MRTRVFQILAVATLVVAHARTVIAAEPGSLTHRVDELIESALPEFSRHASADCTDAEFLRRVSLDLAATIPSAHATRHFLDDSRPSQLKRSEWIDRLLASPAYARRMQYLLDWILMERRTSENIASADWQTYLRQAAAENRPWDQLANEILVETGSDPTTRSRARFYLDRDFDLTVVTDGSPPLEVGPIATDRFQAGQHGTPAGPGTESRAASDGRVGPDLGGPLEFPENFGDFLCTRRCHRWFLPGCATVSDREPAC